MAKEQKIGLVIFISIIASLLLLIWLKGNPFTKYEAVEVLFKNVHGLHKGSVVDYEGFKCGQIVDFRLSDSGIIVKFEIEEPDLKIYSTDKFLIIPNSTIASEYQISIRRTEFQGMLHRPGMIMVGEVVPSLDDFLFGAQDTLDKLNVVMTEANKIALKSHDYVEQLQPILDDIHSLGKQGVITNIANNIDYITTKSNQILGDNKQQIEQSIKTFNQVINQVNHKLELVEDSDIIEAIDSLKHNLNNLNNLTDHIEQEDIDSFMAVLKEVENTLGELSSDDPEEDLASLIIHSAKKIDKIISGLENTLQRKTLFKTLFSRVVVSE